MAKKKVICIDFDGALHICGKDGKLGDMVPKADTATKILKKKGWTVIIHTDRDVDDALKGWLKENGIAYDGINEKMDDAELFVSAGAVTFRGQWDWTLQDIGGFRPWKADAEQERTKMENLYDEANIWARGKEKRIRCGHIVAG